MKTILLFFVFILSQLVSFSQQWCAPGSVWNYKIDDHQIGGTRLGFYELKLAGTETLNGKLCHVISGYYKGILYNKYNPSIAVTTQTFNYTYYTFQASDVIYISRGGRFDTLVNFNAVPGDNWLSTFGDTDCVNGWNARTVVDTGHVKINGLFLRTVKTGSAFFIEGIGGTQGFLYDREECYNDGGTDGEFTCFRSDNFPVYMSPKHSECVNMVSLADSELSVNLKVFPNPGAGPFIISIRQSATARVIDLQGKTVFTGLLRAGENVLQLEALSEGLYVLEINNGHQTRTCKLGKTN